MSENQSPDEMNSKDAGQPEFEQEDGTQQEPAPETADATPEEQDTAAPEGDEVAEEVDPLLEAQAKIVDLEDQLARARADTYNVSQEYNSFVRRSKTDGVNQKQAGIASVIENLLSVLDDIELARQHGDLEGPAGAIATKVENTLETNYGLVRYGAEGDAFDPAIHEALMHTPSEDVTEEQVGTLIQPGYRMGEKIIRPARVGVVSPQ
ncbi:nucleotide exchange factor GrpE [Flaviflexus massiliensis]|uniref:nucleotide exchange factor GrpE n=1 Tax=Flaviflexus massiliensis TaxID=1522309 RepID=UPI0006D544AE|nr:nucleotide exchange factor GrpE [Flaviflexus massiliensis]